MAKRGRVNDARTGTRVRRAADGNRSAATPPAPEYRFIKKSALAAQYSRSTANRAPALPRRKGLLVPDGGGQRTAEDVATAPRVAAEHIPGLDRRGSFAALIRSVRRPAAPPSDERPSHAVLMHFIRTDATLAAALPGAANDTPEALLRRLNAALATLGRPPYTWASSGV